MYNYQSQKSELYSDDGQRMFIKVRDKVQRLLSSSGAFVLEKAISGLAGDSFTMLACIDRLVEFGEIKELPGEYAATQFKVYVEGTNA